MFFSSGFLINIKLKINICDFECLFEGFFVNNVTVFIVTFDQFSAFLQNKKKNIYIFWKTKILLTPDFWMIAYLILPVKYLVYLLLIPSVFFSTGKLI